MPLSSWSVMASSAAVQRRGMKRLFGKAAGQKNKAKQVDHSTNGVWLSVVIAKWHSTLAKKKKACTMKSCAVRRHNIKRIKKQPCVCLAFCISHIQQRTMQHVMPITSTQSFTLANKSAHFSPCLLSHSRPAILFACLSACQPTCLHCLTLLAFPLPSAWNWRWA